MARQLSILCVHGIGHGDADEDLALLEPGDRRRHPALEPDLDVAFDFLSYDDLFDHAPLNLLTYGEAVARLMASGILHGIGDRFAGTRGLGTCRR